jgi:hypothetical protein
MVDDAKWNSVVERLITLTEQGVLEWTENDSSLRENVLGRIYYTSFKDRNILVYEYNYKAYTDEDIWHWDNEVAIEFVDEQAKLQWQWPKSPLRFRLLEAIRYKMIKADSFLDAVLGDVETRLKDNTLYNSMLFWGLSHDDARRLIRQAKSLAELRDLLTDHCPAQGHNYLENSVDLNDVNEIRELLRLPPLAQ